MANASVGNPTWEVPIQLDLPQDDRELAPCAHRTDKEANRKRLVVCCDGTWNNSNKKGNIATNVARLSSAVAHKCCTGMPQIVYYHRGAGTEESKTAQYLGGVLGKGIIQDIADVYRFVCDNYNPGDEVIIIGFSRGAFTARSVSGMICNIGLLNRVGTSTFGEIFHDYQNFPNWKPGTKFNKDDHLMGFTLTTFERIERRECAKQDCIEKRDNAAMEAALLSRKEEIFAESGETKWFPVPTEVKVKAVGVWDTVGSLGWPKMPWEKIRKDRSASELRFASLDVHPNVEHAFHALALDEWRTAFRPTLWGKRGNGKTKLRQVWFPGSHSNVGGGFEDQQIASIALAWMADQLTSIGVEFSTPEMKRIFYTVDPSVTPRDWGMGKIYNPSGSTTIPDKAWDAIWYPWQRFKGENTVLGTRTPGAYKEDDKKTDILEPNELIHPSVRIRYLYDGLGLDDNGDWECAALTRNGYRLEKSKEPLQIEDPNHKDPIASTYKTLTGTVASVHGGHLPSVDPSTSHTLVTHQLPFESDLCLLQEPKGNWVWTKGPGKKTLPEERIGMWERLFIDVNHKLLHRYEKEQQAKKLRGGRQKKRRQSWRSWLSGKYQLAKGMAGSVLNNTLGRLIDNSSVKVKPVDYPSKFGYHDFVSWQRGDSTKVRHRNPWDNGETKR
ncbi:hypothetical protein CCHL11_04367 [Colletotrichum chlorophyti]|uniref:T6SS Phospholipase effector Tle1-like catalytic domain-containing protein n=1 Tax=Colletotrichum chlorophyti TaxID=708187 RepID=A0A1Q8RLI1_9PEZI|nr:hypothetical protein CCHL11_04367 [Colletotrichum chlorophyti]